MYRYTLCYYSLTFSIWPIYLKKMSQTTTTVLDPNNMDYWIAKINAPDPTKRVPAQPIIGTSTNLLAQTPIAPVAKQALVQKAQPAVTISLDGAATPPKLNITAQPNVYDTPVNTSQAVPLTSSPKHLDLTSVSQLQSDVETQIKYISNQIKLDESTNKSETEIYTNPQLLKLNVLRSPSLKEYFKVNDLNPKIKADNIKIALFLAIMKPLDAIVAEYLHFLTEGHITICDKTCYLWNATTKLWAKTPMDVLKKYLFDTLRSDVDKCHDNVDNQDDCRKIKSLSNQACSSGFRDKVFKVFKGYVTDDEFTSRLNIVTEWIPTNDCKLVNIKTAQLRDRIPSDLYTHAINAKFDPKMDPKAYQFVLNYITQLMSGDNSVTLFLLQRLGIFISGNLSDKTYAIFYGSTGDNGKSIFLKLLKSLLGLFYHAASDGVFFKLGQDNANSHTSHLNGLIGKRLSVLCETDSIQRVNVKQIKSLTGDDAVPMRKLHQEEESTGVTITSHSVLVTNNLPQIVADKAMRRRTLVFPFIAKFIDEVKEKTILPDGIVAYPVIDNMYDILNTPPHLDALFHLLVVMAAHYYQKTTIYPIPESVKVATDEFVESGFPYAEFISEECIEGVDFKVRSKELYEEYCSNIGNRRESMKDFYANMRTKYPMRPSTGHVNYFFGIKLRPTAIGTDPTDPKTHINNATKQLGGRVTLSHPPGTVAI